MVVVHELSLAEAIMDTVEARAAGRRVQRVDVRIGHFRQVVPDSLTFAWEMLTEGTALAGSELAIEHVPAEISCRACGERTTLGWPVLLCGACDGHDVELISGQELVVIALHISQEVP